MRRSAALRQINNPQNPFIAESLEWEIEAPDASISLYSDRSRSILSRNDSPDLRFKYSVNPYRGCFHGCAYCYARPTHHYLDFGAGTDFERNLVVKEDAPQLLRKSFLRKSWSGELVLFSGNTDCYQPLEVEYRLTQACLSVCLEFRNPALVITKSAIIERDAQLLAELHQEAYCPVIVSLPFFDREKARAIEPYVPSPQRRLKTIENLSAAGVPVGINIAPIIPGLNDEDVPEILRTAKDAGAQFFSYTMLRLPPPVDEVFEQRLRAQLPLRADRVLHQIEACREGRRYNSKFGERMRGRGVRWEILEQMIEQQGKRFGYGQCPAMPEVSTFERPKEDVGENKNQLELFGELRSVGERLTD